MIPAGFAGNSRGNESVSRRWGVPHRICGPIGESSELSGRVMQDGMAIPSCITRLHERTRGSQSESPTFTWRLAMRGLALLVISSACLASQARAQALERIALPVTPQAAAASPEQDDATLYDVQFVGVRTGWAVGERGVIWRTD